jgi:hypothetical protein
LPGRQFCRSFGEGTAGSGPERVPLLWAALDHLFAMVPATPVELARAIAARTD